MTDAVQLINPPGPITCLAYNKDRTCTAAPFAKRRSREAAICRLRC